MSKCDISIQFENRERTFRSGDTVNGTVTIDVNKNVNCRALKIAGYWKTHGRGNRDSGRYGEKVVFEGDLIAGETQSYPFSISIKDVPLTYHGKLINIDHYVDVRVDIPWGFDPKKRDDFIVLPGTDGNIVEPEQPDPDALGAQIGKSVGVVATIVFCLVGILTLAYGVGFLFLAVGLLIGFFTFRKQLAERRLGEVKVVMDTSVIAPGDSLPISINCTPRKAGKINEVLATLTATETAVSGSGTNRSTYTNKIYNLPFNLQGPESFQAQQEVSFSGMLAIPDTDAYSFDTGDNEISWDLKIKIDIPMWPDWIQKVNLALVPRELLHGDSTAAEETPETTEAEPSLPFLEEESNVAQLAVLAGAASAPPVDRTPPATISEEQEPAAGPVEAVDAEPVDPEPATPTETPAEPAPVEPAKAAISLEETCQLLNESGHDTLDQARIMEAVAKQTFSLTLSIERVSSTYSWDKNSQYNDGKTLIGTLEGTNQQIQILIPSDRNDQMNQLKAGDSWTGTGQITGRDSLFHRIEMNGD
jgi:sporulation-control protein spo0M